MNLKKILILLICLATFQLSAQKVSKVEISYHKDTLDRRFAFTKQATTCHYFDSIKKIHDSEMGQVIGYAVDSMKVFRPQSPLSNFLADILFNYGDSISHELLGHNIDFSILNFGGIRTNIQQGNVTVGNIFSVLPFDNRVVIASISGRDLKKVLGKFDPTAKCQAYSNMQVIYQNGKMPFKYLVNGKPIEDEKVYFFATLDFIIYSLGDGIFEGVKILNTKDTNELFRNVVIRHVKTVHNLSAKCDNRVVILLQN